MKAYVVIGACFGDEGKGLTTDYLAAKAGKNALVVRFNGGAQAGHTVNAPSGLRHVFKHFGSGSFAQSPCYLSEFFICNPMLFRSEWEELNHLGIQPEVFIDPKAIITTPYDMMINQIIEEYRATNRHGSCGVGINETVERSLHGSYSITACDLFDSIAFSDDESSQNSSLLDKLLLIQQEWVPIRLKQLGIKSMDLLTDAWQKRLSSAGILKHYISEIKFFVEHSAIAESALLKSFSTVIFEGAQGLLLDEEKGTFPYVTRSSTGLKNVVKIAKEASITQLEVFYIARSYLTRHGAGPLPFEQRELSYAAIIDKTNIDNPFQGKLRFASFNIDLLKESIASDLLEANDQFQLKVNLMITCMDQLKDEVKYIFENNFVSVPKSQFLAQIQEKFPDFKIYSCAGLTRDFISVQDLNIFDIR